MHTIHHIATQAENVDEAFRRVKDYLEKQMGDDYSHTPTWYDWFVAGGGRWSSSDDPYDDNYTDDVVHSSDVKFFQNIAQALEWRKEETDRYIKQAKEVNLIELLDTVGKDEHDFRVGHQLYSIKKVYDLTLGVWGPDSYFFDMINDTTTDKYMQESLDKGDKSWYLVPVDFHF